MRYALVREQDISNGPGFRVSLFVQGCTRRCLNCFNKETWDVDGGYEWTRKKEKILLDLCDKDHIEGLSILGGEPLLQFEKGRGTEYKDMIHLVKAFKERFPEKTIWVWTGYKWEDIVVRPSRLRVKYVKKFLSYVDILVDGPYKENLHLKNLKFRGSANQRIIDVQKSLPNVKNIDYTKDMIDFGLVTYDSTHIPFRGKIKRDAIKAQNKIYNNQKGV